MSMSCASNHDSRASENDPDEAKLTHKRLHDHDRQHGLSHASRSLAIALGITATVLIAEVIGAVLAGSVSLAADAGHMFIDTLGLVIALVAARLSLRPRSDRYTWGLARLEIISAAFQAGMLLVVCGVVVYEAVERFFVPQPVASGLMLVFGGAGLAGNLISLVALHANRHANLNIRAAFLEVCADSLGSLTVILAAGAMWLWKITWIDSVASLIIAGIMAPRALIMLRRAGQILLEKIPDGLTLDQVRGIIMSHDHVIDVHDLHVSTIATGSVALTAHVTLHDECFCDGHSVEILHQIQDGLAKNLPVEIAHFTLQLDTATHRDHEMLKHPSGAMHGHTH